LTIKDGKKVAVTSLDNLGTHAIQQSKSPFHTNEVPTYFDDTYIKFDGVPYP
jgi:hypothetical protein